HSELVSWVTGRQIGGRDVLTTLADLRLRTDREGPLRILALGFAADHERIGGRCLDGGVGVSRHGLLHVGGRLLRLLLFSLGSSGSGLALRQSATRHTGAKGHSDKQCDDSLHRFLLW